MGGRPHADDAGGMGEDAQEHEQSDADPLERPRAAMHAVEFHHQILLSNAASRVSASLAAPDDVPPEPSGRSPENAFL
jgi:hypothetical protein